ncbi:hypothetical protein P691DRAFT_433861 [Macrolepiota fuliginosa MF-IS2]|uniref:Dynamin stalk domain-containing protein n=1 Tax=Macrolepiota fuliginosa MF-IS2 TaxID=1400762 RepID=A0A9P5X596_9AGAR|nr:hypothetical protein P691DRAFT_433861 [Macrolepiota fuliginosa MF-IS2]
MLSFLQLDQLSCRPSASIQNALNEVAKLIKDFDADMRRHIGGVPYKEGIVQQIRIPCDRFRRDIRRTAPEFCPFEEPEPGRKKTLAAPEFLKHEEEEGRKGEGEGKDGDGLIYVNEVYQRMQESRSRELPGHFPHIIQREYIKDVVIKWESPATRLCEEVYAILTELMKKLVYKHFATFGQGMLEHQIRLIMHEHLTHCLHVAKQGVNWLMKIQDDPLWGMRTGYAQARSASPISKQNARVSSTTSRIYDTPNIPAPNPFSQLVTNEYGPTLP